MYFIVRLTDGNEEKRENRQIPSKVTFKIKNEMAKNMINDVLEKAYLR